MKLLFEERLKSIGDNPSARLLSIGVRTGMNVADLGAGRGIYTLLSAGMVGPEGTVYAVEPDAARAETIRRRAASEGLANVRVMVTGAEKLEEVPGSTVDVALSMNSLHHFVDKAAVFSETRRVLKLGGKFYVRDVIRSWLTRHGTRRDEVPLLPASGFSDKKLTVTWSRFEATFTK